MGAVKVSPSICLNSFHSGVLSKVPEEPADGDHDHLRGRDRGTHTTGNHRGRAGIPGGGRLATLHHICLHVSLCVCVRFFGFGLGFQGRRALVRVLVLRGFAPHLLQPTQGFVGFRVMGDLLGSC